MAYSNSWANNTPANPLAVTVAPAAHDVLYMYVIADATALTMTWPSGFTQIAQQVCTADGQVISVARKSDATGSETSLSASNSQGSNLVGAVVALSGRDNTTPEDFVVNVTNNNSATASAWTLASGSVTPGHAGADLLAIIGHDVDGSNAVVTTFATTSGTTGAWTKRQESGSGFIRGAIGTATQTTAGAFVVTATGTSAGEHAGRSLITIGVKAASGATSHATSGALTGPGSTIAGTSVHKTKHTTSGAITGPGAVIVGTSVHKTKHAASGALTGPGSAVSGTAKRFRAHPSTGALTGPGSSIAGTAKRFRSHGTSGTIAGPGATLAGAAAHSAAAGMHATSGAMVGGGAVLAGIAAHTPGTSPRPDPGDSPGGRSPDRGFDLKRWKRERLDLDSTIQETFDALMGAPVPIREQAELAVADFQRGASVDWAALAGDIEALGRLRELMAWLQREKDRADDDDDEAAAILLLH